MLRSAAMRLSVSVGAVTTLLRGQKVAVVRVRAGPDLDNLPSSAASRHLLPQEKGKRRTFSHWEKVAVVPMRLPAVRNCPHPPLRVTFS